MFSFSSLSLWRRVKRSLRHHLLSQLSQPLPTQPCVSLGGDSCTGTKGDPHHQRPTAGRLWDKLSVRLCGCESCLLQNATVLLEHVERSDALDVYTKKTTTREWLKWDFFLLWLHGLFYPDFYSSIVVSTEPSVITMHLIYIFASQETQRQTNRCFAPTPNIHTHSTTVGSIPAQTR